MQQEAVHMEQATNMETRLAESAPQEPALAQSGSNVLRRHIKENPKKASLARHRLWLDSIPHEYPTGSMWSFWAG